jgi:hypothetical protein
MDCKIKKSILNMNYFIDELLNKSGEIKDDPTAFVLL